MKRCLLFLFVVLLGTTSCKETLCENGIYPFCDDGYTPVGPGTFTEKSVGPDGFAPVSFSIGDKGYVGTGGLQFPPAIFTNQFYSYDPDTDTWESVASLPGTGRMRAFGVATHTKGYVGGGFTSTQGESGPVRVDLEDFWEYDPEQNAWSQKANLPGGAGEYMALEILGNVYVAKENSFWKYTPSADIWEPKANSPVTNGLTFSIGPLGYVVSGEKLWEYNAVTDKWTAKADYPGQTMTASFATATKGYILNSDVAWEYNPVTNRWYEKGEIPRIKEARQNGIGLFLQTAFGLDDKGYFGISYRGQTQHFYEFDPE